MEGKRAAGRPRRGPGWRPGVGARLRDPVIVILLLAGFFDGLAGNPIHALVLWGAGLGLVIAPPRVGPAPDPPGPDAYAGPGPSRWAVAVPVAVAFGIVAGSLDRYTWPVTVAVVVPGVAAVVVAGRTRWQVAPAERFDPLGAGLWVAALVALGVFELANFVLQPDRLTGSYDHPTLSTLFNDVVTTHPRQGAALTIWLLFGWWLVDR